MAARAASGRLHRVHRGVFVVGHPLISPNGRYMAAVLACGRGALLSHRSAAALWDLRRDDRPRIDVTVRCRRGVTSALIDAHRSRTLVSPDVAAVHGIPCTSVARTLVDLAEVLDLRALERAVERAEVLRLLDLDAAHDALERAHGRRGAPKLRSLLADGVAGESITRSELEERFLALCDAAALPRPTVNAWLTLGGGEEIQVDFLWSHAGLIVEADGHTTHGTRRAFERDRRRDQLLQLAGYRVARFTWRQVTREPEQVKRTVRGLLSRAA